MYYLLYPLLFLFIVMLFFGLKGSIALLKHKTVGKFALDETLHTFTINKPGLYSINIVGAGWSENQGDFFPDIKEQHKNKSLELTIPFVSVRSMSNGVKMTEYAHFTANTAGTYTLQCKNVNDLAAKQSQLPSQRIFQNKLHTSHLGICIKQALSTRGVFVAIIFTVFGVQGIAFTLMALFKVFK